MEVGIGDIGLWQIVLFIVIVLGLFMLYHLAGFFLSMLGVLVVGVVLVATKTVMWAISIVKTIGMGKRIIIIFLFILTPFIIYLREGGLEVRLDQNAEIYATKYTWWGLGPDKEYYLKKIKGTWHIRERGFPEWKPIYLVLE